MSQSTQIDSGLKFKDFMPHDEQTGHPVKKTKPGSLRFHCNLGSCYDSVI